MKNLLTILLVLVFVAPPVSAATDDNRYGRYYVSDRDDYAVVYRGKRYGVDRDYRGYPNHYNSYGNSPMSEFLAICSNVRERKRDDCIQDAIKERQKLIKRYYD